MPNVGPTEWLVILLILLLLFGPSRLAGLGAAAGKTLREFRKGLNEIEDGVATGPSRTSRGDGEIAPRGSRTSEEREE
jgi:sec-independent protein translocase protein TatA